jgi:hypothetical protein
MPIMTCSCGRITIPPGTPESEQPALRVLEYMKHEGFSSLLPFLEATFNSQNHGMKSRLGRFYANGGFKKTVKLMTEHSRFRPETRVTRDATNELKEYLGDEVLEICLRIFQQVKLPHIT